jgi:predicted ATPase with chaperone activity
MSMLARRLTTILPAMALPDALDTTRIHRVAGRTGACTAVVTTRPFRASHHPISDAGLIGGGHVPMPGAGRAGAHHSFARVTQRWTALTSAPSCWAICSTGNPSV